MPLDELDHEMRRTGFTSTEAAAIYGEDDERDFHSVVVEKAFGRIPLPETDYLLRGKFLERGLLDWWSYRSKKPVEPLFTKSFRHPKYPNVIASPDALLINEPVGIDIKTLSWHQGHKYGATADDMPPKTQLQAVVCMEVTNKDRWIIVVYWNDQLREIEMERDREFGEFICSGLQQKWERHVVGKEMPPIGSSKISAAWLQQKYPTHKRPDIRPATNEEIALLRSYAKLRAELKRLDKERDRLENQLKEAVKGREGFEFPGGRFTWRRIKDSTYVDWQAMAIALRTYYIKDPDPKKQEEARQKVTDDHTRPKPGMRRIAYICDEFSEQEETADAA